MKSHQIHEELKKLLLEQAEGFKDPSIKRFFEKDLKWHELFDSYRISEQNAEGLKLTPKGLGFFSLLWQSYEIPTQKPYDQLPLVLLWLDRTQVLPYYIDKKRVVFFDEESAMIVKLSGGALARLATQWFDTTTPTYVKYFKNGR
jgi:hypothetical protein